MSVREEIEQAIKEYQGVFIGPYSLPPNLELAARALAEATRLITNLVDPDPCEYDHNHSCQTHGDFYIPKGQQCATQEAKDWIGY